MEGAGVCGAAEDEDEEEDEEDDEEEDEANGVAGDDADVGDNEEDEPSEASCVRLVCHIFSSSLRRFRSSSSASGEGCFNLSLSLTGFTSPSGESRRECLLPLLRSEILS